jgi:uncharacterized phage-associated protein
MAKAIDIARLLIKLAADEEEQEQLTHMRLQKLLYYVQGYSLAYRGRPMFAERIKAWRHGPVVPEVYPCFANYGSAPIALHEAKPVELDPEDEEFVVAVWESYRIYSPIALRNMTHRETPWKNARRGLTANDPSVTEITTESIEEFFKNYSREQMLRQSGISPEALKDSEKDAGQGKLVSWQAIREGLVHSP